MIVAIDLQRLKRFEIPTGRQSYTARDCLLYALGVGCGIDPSREDEAVWLDMRRIRALPAMATVLGYGGLWGSWCPPGLAQNQILHASQSLRLHRPLPSSGSVLRESRIADILDKGPGKALLIQTVENLRDALTGDLLATMESVIYCRGAGGGGGTIDAFPPPAEIPDRAPDHVHTIPTSPQQGRLYSLSGDENPLHWDRAAAAEAGLARPILQGLSTYGAACAALVSLYCGNDPAQFGRLEAQFTGPVIPGDQLELRLWHVRSGDLRFRLFNRDRNAMALDNGRLRKADAAKDPT